VKGSRGKREKVAECLPSCQKAKGRTNLEGGGRKGEKFQWEIPVRDREGGIPGKQAGEQNKKSSSLVEGGEKDPELRGQKDLGGCNIKGRLDHQSNRPIIRRSPTGQGAP